MAADSRINETEAGTATADDKPPSMHEQSAGPPRPPRPAQRASGALRIPLPNSPGLGGSAARAAPTPRAPASPVPDASMGASSAPPQSAVDTPRRPEVLPTASPAMPAAPTVALSLPVVQPDDLAGTNYEFPLTRTKPPSAPVRFDSAVQNLSEQAPSAPFTPWRGVPALTHETPLPSDLSVPRAASLSEPSLAKPAALTEPSPRPPARSAQPPSSHSPVLTRESSNSASSPPVPITAEDDREDTLVGEVAKDLLDLSSMEGDEHTRAYQAPQELIDLARRQREERLLSKGNPARAPAASSPSRAPPVNSPSAAPPVNSPSAAPAVSFNSGPPAVDRTANTFRPKGAAPAAAAKAVDQDEPRLTTEALDTIPPSSDADGAAPPVARSRPARSLVSEEPSGRVSPQRAPASLSELAQAASDRHAPDSMPAVSEVISPPGPPSALPVLSTYDTPWSTRWRLWILMGALFMAVGYALARWRGLDLLFPR